MRFPREAGEAMRGAGLPQARSRRGSRWHSGAVSCDALLTAHELRSASGERAGILARELRSRAGPRLDGMTGPEPTTRRSRRRRRAEIRIGRAAEERIDGRPSLVLAAAHAVIPDLVARPSRSPRRARRRSRRRPRRAPARLGRPSAGWPSCCRYDRRLATRLRALLEAGPPFDPERLGLERSPWSSSPPRRRSSSSSPRSAPTASSRSSRIPSFGSVPAAWHGRLAVPAAHRRGCLLVDPSRGADRPNASAAGALRNGDRSPGRARAARRYWRAANYLSVGQIYLLDNPLLREPLRARARQAAAARPLRHDARAEPDLRAPEPRDPRARPRRDLRSPAPATAGPASSRTPTSRAPTASSTRTSRATRRACRSSSASSRSPAGSRATSRPRRRARSTRAASSATRSRTRTAPPSTTPTCSSAASSATARPRPGRSPRAGTRTSSSTPRPTAPCCRSCT